SADDCEAEGSMGGMETIAGGQAIGKVGCRSADAHAQQERNHVGSHEPTLSRNSTASGSRVPRGGVVQAREFRREIGPESSASDRAAKRIQQRASISPASRRPSTRPRVPKVARHFRKTPPLANLEA